MELLVVVAIIGILVALLLPAVQAAREAARRTQCLNHLRQVGLATWGYVDSSGAFPPGYKVQLGSDGSVGNSGVVLNGFLALVLPYLEEGNVESLYDSEQGFDHDSNQQAVNTRIPTFVCPSASTGDRRVPLLNRWALFTADLGHTGEATDYFGIRNVIEGASELVPDNEPNVNRVRGVFRVEIDPAFGGQPTPERPLRPAQITDGTSKTAMLVEISGRPKRHANGRELPAPIAPYYSGAWAGVNGEMLYELDTDTAIEAQASTAGDCVLNCHNFYTPYSFHPGGVHVMLCDGSAHFVADNLDFATWLAVVQPDDGELFEIPW